MTTESNAPSPFPRSEEEQEASARKLRAEAAVAEAKAAEARAEATIAALKADKAADEDRARRAGDEYNHVYRFADQVSAGSVESCMIKLTQWSRQTPGCDIEVIFSSPGGSVIDGFVLYDFLRDLSNKGHHITTGMQGMAASMAGILMQAGDTRWTGAEAWYMIHRAAFGTSGKTFENEDRVEWIKRVEKRIIQIFVDRSDLTAQKIKRNWDRKDWWLDSDEALAAGLVDEVRGGHVND